MASGGEDTSDEIFNFKCTACAKRNRNKKAVKYCVECQGYCCQSCVDTHEVFPTLETHNLLDRASLKSSVLMTDLPEIPTERCSIHETNLVNMYCEKHDAVGCTTCMVLEHRTCTDVQSIPGEINKLFRLLELEKVSHILREKTLAVKKVKEANVALLGDLNKSKDEAVKAIKDFRKELESCLEKLEEESLKEVEKEFHKKETILKQQIEKLKDEVNSLKHAGDNLEKSDGNKAQQFVLMKVAQQKADKAEEISDKIGTQTETKIVFVVNKNIQDYLKQLLTLGSVSHVPLNQRQTLYTIKATRDIDIKGQNDTKKGDIHGSCLTEEGLLLLADCNNKKLKRADIDKMTIVDQCDLPGYPQSVCCTSASEAVVCLSDRNDMKFAAQVCPSNSNAIQFISLGNPMAATRQIKVNHYCYGLCYHNNELYVTDHGSSLYIYNLTGSLLQTVSRDSSGYNLFTKSQKIALSDNRDKLFVADLNKGVVSVSTKGKYIETFGDTGVSEASAVCTDYQGNVFVYDKSLNNVVQVTQNGKEKLGVLVKKSDGVQKSLSISFDPRRCTLIVTQCDNNKAKLFDLQ